MLQSLHIRNLALVASLDLDLSGGFNVITGETGAGKSLVIGALQLLAGGRATPSLIRRGEKSCEVSAFVNLSSAKPDLREMIESKLHDAGLPACEDGGFLLRRTVTENGSRPYVNGSPVTVSFLKELGELIIDIHGPHDNQTILKNARQLELLDVFAQTLPLLKTCKKQAQELAECKRQLQELEREGLQPEQLDLLKHQLNEIDHAELQPGEDEAVLKKYKLAENAKRLLQLANQAATIISGDEHSILDQIAAVFKMVREIDQHDPEKAEEFNEQLEAAHDSLQELTTQFEDYAMGLDLDPEEIQETEARLELIQKLKRKYGPSMQDIFDTKERLLNSIEKIEGRGELIEKLRQNEENARRQLNKTCDELDRMRRAAADPLAKAITEKLKNLGFDKAEFSIRLDKAEPGPNGANTVEFLFAANVGEDAKPLKTTASSGETARVMLALKTVLSDADDVPVLVFDEIDANVGGRTAPVVAAELKSVATKHQVFSITHLAPIAAAANTHFLVQKTTDETRTTATMRQLEPAERIDEITRMLGADQASTAARKHARELLNM